MNTSFLIITLILLLLSLLLAGISLWSRSRSRSRSRIAFRRRLDNIIGVGTNSAAPIYRRLLIRFLPRAGGGRRLAQAQDNPARAEIRMLLARAGWYRREAWGLFHGATLLLPVVGVAMAMAYALSAGLTGARVAALMVVSGGSGFLLPRYILRYRASRRQRQIAREVPVMLRILNVLFEAGLSLEHALSILREQAGELLPALLVEIDLFVQRVNAGVDRVVALEQVAADMDVPELSDAVAVLTQSSQLGGGVRHSLTRLAQTIEERDMVAMRETIGRLSAKMTIVMVVFLFPALFIFLAGPGLLAVGRALGGVSG